jgi:hypothetical protein
MIVGDQNSAEKPQSRVGSAFSLAEQFRPETRILGSRSAMKRSKWAKT